MARTGATPTDIPTRAQPLPVPIHASSAPCDFRLARSSASPAFSPYTLHLAHHVKSHQHLPLPPASESWREGAVPRPLPGPDGPAAVLRRHSGSSSTSTSSPMTGSPADAGAMPCRALVASSRGAPRGRPAARQLYVVDGALDSRQLLSSPEGMLPGSSGRSDLFSSRGWSPANAAAQEWGSWAHRQRLISHPDGDNACSMVCACSCRERLEHNTC